MRIISKRKIREYVRNHAQAELPLLEWYLKMQEVKVIDIYSLREKYQKHFKMRT